MSNPNYTRQLISDYCVLDTETTGLSAYYDEVIEIGILKVRNNNIVEKFSQLIKPEHEIDDFITDLTGITNDMVCDKPSILEVKDNFLSFIGNDVIVGHNTSFDIRFINEGMHIELSNSYIDTMQFAKKIYPDLKHHRLSDMVDYLNLSNNEHRALADCISTKELYDSEKKKMEELNIAITDLWKPRKSRKRIDVKSIIPDTVEVNKDSFFYDRHVVFTGKLEKMIRKDAMQLVVNLGGKLDNSVTKETNYLILGNNDYNMILHGEKSSKHRKAEKLKLKGQDIDIIDELTFYDILTEEGIF